jgi:AcrR family transcriptional regulator
MPSSLYAPVEASGEVRARDPKLDSEKARRIVEAMRVAVGRYGTAGATFDRVALEAGVSRGLLHHYFRTKERLLAATVRREAELLIKRLDERLAAADSADSITDALLTPLEDFLGGGRRSRAVMHEMLSDARRSDEIRQAIAHLYRGMRERVASRLREKHRAGVVELRTAPEAVATVVIALGDGLEPQLIADPGWDSSRALAMGACTTRFLLGTSD